VVCSAKLLTISHKTLWVKWLIEHATSHQGSAAVNIDSTQKSPMFHTADR